MVVPLKRLDVDAITNELKNLGLIFYSKKTNMIYVADEIVRILRKTKGKTIADKHFRRILIQLKEPQINLICKKHNIDWRQPLEVKIKEIIKEGISVTNVLSQSIYKDGTNVSEKKKFISELCDKNLTITPPLKGATLDDKLANLIHHFEEIESDDNIGISVDGFEKLLRELNEILPKTNTLLKQEFELQDENVMSSSYLLDYNIKPRDILELIPVSNLETFCLKKEIKTRGDIIQNILEAFKDSENLYLENYEKIGFRDLASLKDSGIKVKESELGVLFEELTKTLFIKTRV